MNSLIERKITIDTVMGVLNRIIGDQRKLYQSRADQSYYFKDIDVKNYPLIKFDDVSNKRVETNEMIYIRNITPNTYDKASFIGAINIGHPLISSDYSPELWAILDLNLEELIDFILEKKEISNTESKSVTPLKIGEALDKFKDIKVDKALDENNIRSEELTKTIEYFKHDSAINNQLKNQFLSLQKTFSDIEYIKNGKIVVRALYCSSLYLQAIRLSTKYSMDGVVLKGFSVNGFTQKDFMSLFTGGKKKVYGNPYAAKEFKALKPLMVKASGKLEINIDVDKEKSREIERMIENAGVSSFYLGKKGLAYVSNIRV